jgi:hypothetical protein
VGLAAVVALVVLLSAWLLRDVMSDPAGGTGQRPDTSGTTSSPSAAVTTTTGRASGDPTPVLLDDRLPPTGFVTLGVGEVHRYRFQLSAPEDVYLQGIECNHQLPVVLARVGGNVVANVQLGCRTEGPYQLAAGDYVLRFGAEGVGGRYAFRLLAG